VFVGGGQRRECEWTVYAQVHTLERHLPDLGLPETMHNLMYIYSNQLGNVITASRSQDIHALISTNIE